MENLHWNQDTMPSEILKQILDNTRKSKNKTLNNEQALAFAYGKALAMEYLLNIERTIKLPTS